ncbi:MAG: transglycosylase domain-containing protein [Bacteroidales bacterium]|nr:transglycosylase domain-containing protein [Bacteroidales bacterium]
MKIVDIPEFLLFRRHKGRIVLFIAVAVGILSITIYFSFRNIAFERGLKRVAGKFAALHYQFTWKDGRIVHFNRISMHEIMLNAETDSTWIKMDSVSLKFGLFPAMLGKMRIKEISCRAIELFYTYSQSASDTNAIYVRPVALARPSYSAVVSRLIRRFFTEFPHKIDIDSIRIIIPMDENNMRLTFLHSQVRRGIIRSFLHTGEETDTTKIFLEGHINRKKLSAQLAVSSPDQNRCILSIPGRHPVVTGFDTLLISFSVPHYSHKLVTIEGSSVSKGLSLEGESLCSRTIILDRLLSSFTLHIMPGSVELDSASRLTINNVSLHPFVFISKNPHLVVNFKICPVYWEAGTFFRSLPDGMFTSLAGFNASGDVRFFLDFSVDMSLVDSLKFSSALTARNFRILNFGIDDYRMLNTEFIHRFYERGNLVASFPVGPSSSDFTALADISPWLKIAVLTSEDGSFYYHKGFNPRAIQESIIANIKERRFVRGGSTISMQLVKNVFLNRNKTLGRKLEELLIVWIIENKRLVSKERMYEVYLNIIEWGPGIYGIRQASDYYFNKHPADLNLQESLFLAGIVPFPKRFKSVFESNGFPKTYFTGYMQRMKEIMVSRNYILPDDTAGADQHVFLTGPAAQVFMIPDTAIADTVRPDEMYILPHIVVHK